MSPVRRLAAVAAAVAARRALLLLALPALAACRVNVTRRPAAVEPVFVQPDGPPRNPFSPAVRVGSLIYLAGTLGTRPEGGLVPGGIQGETRQAMENMRRTLGAMGLGLDRLVKCTVFLADLAEWPAMNEVYRSYFPDQKYPARAAVQATLLNGARVELDCVAAAK